MELNKIDLMVCKNCKYFNLGVCNLDGKGNKTPENNSCANWDEQIYDKEKDLMKICYERINNILRYYLDWDEEKYLITTLWIIGTYFHNNFPAYPYLFLNAMKSSGKTRALNIITSLSKDGKLLNSLTEAVMFRTKGTLGIDEFEGIERKGKESLRELLNSAYKRGTKVERMKKVKTLKGEEQVVESFDVYRPIVMANISGMESVLSDRCISMVIEKSFNKKFINLVENFSDDEEFKKTKELLNECSLCSYSYAVECLQVYRDWNNYVTHNYTNYTNNTNYTNYTNYISPFKNLDFDGLNGRHLELSFPLILIASKISQELTTLTTFTLKSIFSAKKDEDFIENTDISLIDFVSQEPEESINYFVPVTRITDNFRSFLQINDDWLNVRWMGKALKRLGLVIDHKRMTHGVEVRLNIKKAQEKIKGFR